MKFVVVLLRFDVTSCKVAGLTLSDFFVETTGEAFAHGVDVFLPLLLRNGCLHLHILLPLLLLVRGPFIVCTLLPIEVIVVFFNLILLLLLLLLFPLSLLHLLSLQLHLVLLHSLLVHHHHFSFLLFNSSLLFFINLLLLCLFLLIQIGLLTSSFSFFNLFKPISFRLFSLLLSNSFGLLFFFNSKSFFLPFPILFFYHLLFYKSYFRLGLFVFFGQVHLFLFLIHFNILQFIYFFFYFIDFLFHFVI